MRRYFVKVKVCGKWIPAEAAGLDTQYCYFSLDAANVVVSVLRDRGYEVRVDVTS
jgi:hypothetical protein